MKLTGDAEKKTTKKTGDDDAGGDEKPKRKRKPYTGPSGTARQKIALVRERTREVTSRMAELLDERDPELAQILREDGAAMGDCLAQLAKLSPLFRKVVLVLLAILEPVRAFGRLGRLLGQRMGEWQARRIEAYETAQRADGGAREN